MLYRLLSNFCFITYVNRLVILIFFIEDINIAGKDAAKATNDLRTDAEAFTQKAKDQWTDNYKRTEVALREKSDKSSFHLSALQSLTGWCLINTLFSSVEKNFRENTH